MRFTFRFLAARSLAALTAGAALAETELRITHAMSGGAGKKLLTRLLQDLRRQIQA